MHQISKDQLSVNSSDNAPAYAMYCTREEFGPEEHLTCYADCFFFSLNLIWGGKQEINLSCCFVYKQVPAHSPGFFLPHLEHSPAVMCWVSTPGGAAQARCSPTAPLPWPWI